MNCFIAETIMARKKLPTKVYVLGHEYIVEEMSEKLFNETFKNPINDGSGNIRKNLRIADKLLYQAGWTIKNGIRINEKTSDVTLNSKAIVELIHFDAITNMVMTIFFKFILHGN